MVGLDHRLQARLVERDDAVVQAVDLGLVDVHAHHLVADFGQAGSGDESDVAGSEDRNAHAVPLPYYWFAPGLTISSSSSSNTRVAFGGIWPPAVPVSPYPSSPGLLSWYLLPAGLIRPPSAQPGPTRLTPTNPGPPPT